MTTTRSDGADSLRVIVIGGGGTGIALAYDLSLRGCSVLLLERGEITSGTTGRHHGQLHSGARYAVHDRGIGAECYQESLILNRIARQSIEYNSGLFCAIDEADLSYLPEFLVGCREAGIPARELPVGQALAMEPGITSGALGVVEVPDGTIDAFRLVAQFAASAVAAGATIRPFSPVTGIDVFDGRVTGVEYLDRTTGVTRREPCDVAVNATGAWSGEVAALARCTIDVTPSPGTMVSFAGRHVDRVVSRLHPPGDGDIVVPQRISSIIGSTQRISDRADGVDVLEEDVELLRRAGALLVPAIAEAPVEAAWAAARPLAGRADGTGGAVRSLSRDFSVIDHSVIDGVEGCFSVVGGKATVLRRMAEDTADLLCSRYGIASPCVTAERELSDYRDYYRLPAGGA